MRAGSAERVEEVFISTEKQAPDLTAHAANSAVPAEAPAPTEEISLRRDLPFYILAALFGIGSGWADVAINDLLLTALLVLASCMVLGFFRPRWPWRWVVAVGMFVPVVELAADLIRTIKPTDAQVWGSFLAWLPGIAGAYGTSFMRTMVDNLRHGR